MKRKKAFLFGWFILTLVVPVLAQSTKEQGFAFKVQSDKKQIDLIYNGKLLTTYCYYDSIMKPTLFPVNTVSGVAVTRGYPLASRAGDRADHPHHIGMWLNYENVNGLDFWNTSTARPFNARSKYGTIYHGKILKSEADKKQATLEVNAQWKRHDNVSLLAEATSYVFHVEGNDFIIDRTTTLKALEDVNFKDAKDGFFAIRVARELELPSTENVTLVNADLTTTSEGSINNENVSGNYLSSEGLKGNDVWATRARWMILAGKINGKNISIAIIDHPKNTGYPSYWHARGYGLFAINPLGQNVFSKGKESLNFVIKKNDDATFRYRVVIHEGTELKPADVELLAESFGKSR